MFSNSRHLIGRGPSSDNRFENDSKSNYTSERTREQERQATGGGEVFFMRKKDDLSSKDAEVVLAEYAEEYPPLFNMTGMASIIKIWRRRTCRDKPMDRKYDYGEPAYYTQSPFLGHVNGETSQGRVQNLFSWIRSLERCF